ncbi:glucosamine-6-phosphate deaminase [Collinsella sp. AGMB00827]|uniref:Glucosamine-6-phosphate deaminase n=1 Tax=Collinsella ureilytica TaxID=2869515 RepID=A0ABS7MID3_9ACTN|nr:glucosamine-6-phosphate deaminase [Collinsella urealyticum]MBY4797124.1 glucosamine-6-phosphate deaminase [Collinsella urealyticum]
MRIIRTANYEEMSVRVAAIIAAQITLKPASKLGLATGSTPLGAYRELVAAHREGALDFSQVSTYNLDEYRGLSGDDPQSYRYFMDEHLFSQVNIDRAQTHVPDGSNLDAAEACASYDRLLEAAGYVDLQLLGIGNNGHIGFNEPDDCFATGTHCVDLTESTIEANSRLFESPDDVPRQAYTMGIQAIMFARRVVVAASGTKKAEAVRAMCEGLVTPSCPASILQLHPDVILIADEEALSLCH